MMVFAEADFHDSFYVFRYPLKFERERFFQKPKTWDTEPFSLRHLSAAYIILLIGVILSSMAFLVERLRATIP